MIFIDGQNTNINLRNFANLEEVLVKMLSEPALGDRIITDVLVDDEAFSEIYPHQAEDISTDEVNKLEIISRPMDEMATDITVELHKVIKLMGEGSWQVSDLFRRAEDSEALEMYQDLLDVTRNFLNMISVLRGQFSASHEDDFTAAIEEMSDLFTEMVECMENEDWVLLADLLEYEFIPTVNRWEGILSQLNEDIKAAATPDTGKGSDNDSNNGQKHLG